MAHSLRVLFSLCYRESISSREDKLKAKKNEEKHYGYKNHVNADQTNKLVQNFAVSDAAVHDSQVFEELLDRTTGPEGKKRPVYADSAYRSHILICFIAYALVRQAMYRTARQYEPMSFDKIRNELLHAQASILVDTATNKKYILPSKTTPIQRKIYHIFGLKRSEVPRPMT